MKVFNYLNLFESKARNVLSKKFLYAHLLKTSTPRVRYRLKILSNINPSAIEHGPLGKNKVMDLFMLFFLWENVLKVYLK
jgi:hypothetical protein